MNYSRIYEENQRRKMLIRKPYNPLTGEGSYGERRRLSLSDSPIPEMDLPVLMFQNGLIKELAKHQSIASFLLSIHHEPNEIAIEEVWEQLEKVRIFYDFEYWAFRGVWIKQKGSPDDIPFYLNRGQRKFLKIILDDFWAGKPMRYILLKARQWGGSTLVQVVMAWIQLVHLRQWNSIIAAHVENTARLVRAMYAKLLSKYPKHWLDGFDPDQKMYKDLKLTPFEGAKKTNIFKPRQVLITIGSAEKPESIRGGDESMAHLTEVGLWKATDGKKPEDLVQATISGIQSIPKTMIVYESTAKGVGNFFNREYLRAKEGKNGFTPVFIAFFDIDLYTEEIPDYKEFIKSMNPDEWSYWEAGATLEAIAWRRTKKKESSDEWRFISEFPGNDIEAFQSTGHRFYPIQDVARLRKGCLSEPVFVGDIHGKDPSGENALKDLKFKEERDGPLKIWAYPGEERCTERYVAVMDIGGRSDHSDNSVICIIDRFQMIQGGVPEIVAEWCGHIDHDLLAWKGAQLATIYHNALLIIESNTLETENTEGDHFEYILDEIARNYDNLFSRTPSDKRRQGQAPRWGFHTNRASKQMVCDHQKKALREDMYIENSKECCDEHDTLEVKENGSIGAVDGCHDDRHITRAIGIWAAYQYMSAPKIIDRTERRVQGRVIQNESSF